ncbi:MAG: DUF4388 domain-containing protein [Thermoanaerobaculia bacterium]
MGITGNLKTMELAELLQWLSQAQKTGTLVVNNGRVEKRIFFRDGMVVSSASTDPQEYLGHFLVSHGFITEMELAQAVQMQTSNKMLLGKILVTIGAISEPELHRMLRLKAEESIYDVFTWSEGDFRFLDAQLPLSNMVPIALDVAAIVLEGLQRLDEWKRIRDVVPNSLAIPVVVGTFDEKLMTEGARQILALIDDERTIGDLARMTHSSEFHVCRILFRQHQAGRLKVVKPRPPSLHVPAAASTTAEMAPFVVGGSISAEMLMSAARQLIEKREYDATLRHVRAAKALEPETRKVQTEGQKLEERIRDEVEREGVTLASRPLLARPMEELTKLQISPQEGFMLTRIDGSYDLQSILKISPLPPLDAQLVFWRLFKAGHIRFEK